MKGFSKEEREAIQTIVRGAPAENIAKALGKFGFTEGHASSMLLGSLGSAAGYGLGGPVGAIAVPAIGTVARKAAQTMTRENAQLADDLVRAGTDARKIAQAYMRAIPKKDRKVEELMGLLLTNGANFNTVKQAENRLLADAAFFASVVAAGEGSDPIPGDEPVE